MCPFFTQGFKANAPTPRGLPARGPRPGLKLANAFSVIFLQLLNRHRFRQIAWLIYVTAAADRDVISQQLKGNNRQNW